MARIGFACRCLARMADMLKSPSLSSRPILTCAALLAALTGVIALSTSVFAQAGPAPMAPNANPMCVRLEAQLAALNRGASGDPTRDGEIRRYQDSATRQRAELDRVVAQAKRMGCNSGFFSLFNDRAQCGSINGQIQQMRANLDQVNSELQRLQSGGGLERDNQRRSVLLALAQNNCGQQYVNAVQQSSGGFLNNLFGGGNNNPEGLPSDPTTDVQSGTYRTVCVRTCDGGFFPISFATVPARFADDERTCKAQCPAAEASLYTYRNPGEDMNSAVTLTGQPYTALPNAFKFRTEYNPSCSCKPAGETWAQALKSIDDRAAAQQGDIIVTEESAKKMQQRQLSKANAKKGAPTPPAATSNPAVSADTAADTTATTSGKKPIRTVGPTFIVPKQ